MITWLHYQIYWVIQQNKYQQQVSNIEKIKQRLWLNSGKSLTQHRAPRPTCKVKQSGKYCKVDNSKRCFNCSLGWWYYKRLTTWPIGVVSKITTAIFQREPNAGNRPVLHCESTRYTRRQQKWLKCRQRSFSRTSLLTSLVNACSPKPETLSTQRLSTWQLALVRAPCDCSTDLCRGRPSSTERLSTW